MRERDLQRKCIAWCRGRGLLAVNIHGSGYSNKGFPDLLVFGGGKCCAVELKAGTGYKLQPDQIVWQRRFEAAGVPHGAPESLKDFEEFVERSLS